MNLKLKLPLAFALSLALLFAGAMFGIYQLNRAISTFENEVLLHVAAHKKAAEVPTRFSTAIQDLDKMVGSGTAEKTMVAKLTTQTAAAAAASNHKHKIWYRRSALSKYENVEYI